MAGKGTPFGNQIQLYCERGFLLRVGEDRNISGTTDKFDAYTHLSLKSGSSIGTVKIKGLQSGLYICLTENGALYGEINSELPGTTFKECLYGSYNCYESTDYRGRFIGINKKGEVKNGNKTEPGKKSTKFLPRRI